MWLTPLVVKLSTSWADRPIQVCHSYGFLDEKHDSIKLLKTSWASRVALKWNKVPRYYGRRRILPVQDIICRFPLPNKCVQDRTIMNIRLPTLWSRDSWSRDASYSRGILLRIPLIWLDIVLILLPTFKLVSTLPHASSSYFYKTPRWRYNSN